MQENIALVQNGFRILLPDMAGYICRELSRVYKNGWWQEVLTALSDQYDLPSSGAVSYTHLTLPTKRIV